MGMEPVIACTLTADDLAGQAARWRRLLRRAGAGRIETDDGIRVAFHDDAAVEHELRALVAVERQCCAWAHWEVLRDEGELALRVTSSADGAAALHVMFKER